jgi:hypothetical protein
MQPPGECFRESIGKRLHHDGGVIVVRPFEALGGLIRSDAGSDREGADVIGQPAGARRHVIGQRQIGAPLAARELLAQRVQHCDRLAARLITEKENIVALAVCRPEGDHAICGKPTLVSDPAKHGQSILVQAARCSADLGVLQDRGNFPASSQVAKNGDQSMNSASSASE